MDIQMNSSAQKYKDQGNQAYKAQDYSKAINYYTRAIQIQEDPSFYSNRAICYFNLHRYEECIRDCDRAIRINPQFAKVYKKKFQACINMLKFEEAVDAAKAYAGIEKSLTANNELQEVESLKSNYERYVIAERDNELPEALSCINHLVSKIPHNKTLKMYKAETLAKLGQTDEAQQLLNTIHGENSPEFYYLKGIISLYNGDSVKAKTFFADGLKLDPENVKCQRALNKAKRCEAYKEQGNDLIKHHKHREAIAKYSEALSLDPYNKKLNSIIYSNRALCYMKIGEKIKALEDLNKSLELDPNYTKSLVRRAQLNMEREQYTAAIHDYVKIQELDPKANFKAKIEEAKKKERQAKKKDYYAILGVSKDATEAEIKKAYKALALKYHPDRNRGKSEVEQQQAAKKFKDVAEANGVLSDPEKRKKYDCGQMEFDTDAGFSGFDNMGENMHFNMGGNGGTTKFFFNGTDMGGAGMDPSQIFSMFFNQGGDGFPGFGPGMRSRANRGPSSQSGNANSRGNTQANFSGFEGFPGFGGFGNFGGFSQNHGNFNFS